MPRCEAPFPASLRYGKLSIVRLAGIVCLLLALVDPASAANDTPPITIAPLANPPPITIAPLVIDAPQVPSYAPPAREAPPVLDAPPTREEVLEAESEWHYRRAQQAIDLNAWWTAMQEFQAAAGVMSPQQLDYEIARCLAQLGREPEAIARYWRLGKQRGSFGEAARVRLLELDQSIYERAHPPRSAAGPLIAGAGAVLAAGVGGVLVGSALPALNALRAIDCPAPCGTHRSLEMHADLGYAFLGLAGAIAIADVVLWVRWKRSHEPAPQRVYRVQEGLRF